MPARRVRPTPTIAATYERLALARARLAGRDDEIVRSQIAVAQIPAPTGDETERANWIARRFSECGLQGVRRDEAGNVIGHRAGADDETVAPLVVCAHLDTVFPKDTDLSVRREGSRLVGPGINDNGRGLAVMLAVAGAIDGRMLTPKRRIDFVATTGEEGLGDLRGAKHYFASERRRPHAVIALDGAGDERIIHRALGSSRFRIVFRGPGGHSWAAFGAPNAVHAAAIAAAKLAALPLPAEPRTTLSVGRIGGGLSVNSIPDMAWLEVDLRSTAASSLARFERSIAAVAATAGEEENARRAFGTRALSVSIERIGSRPCGETPPEHPLVRIAVEATRLVGREADLALASTDANVAISQDIPAIAIGGGGRGGDAHSLSEWFDNTRGPLGVARALTIVVAAAALAAE